MAKPSNAPLYCAIYPELAELVRKHGYALAIHGSLQRDFDLICIPWVAAASEPDEVVKDICNVFALEEIGKQEVREHGRLVHTIKVSYGECFIDLSFTPLIKGNSNVT